MKTFKAVWVVVERSWSRVRLQTFRSWLCHITAAQCKGGYANFVGLSFCIYNMEVIIICRPLDGLNKYHV